MYVRRALLRGMRCTMQKCYPSGDAEGGKLGDAVRQKPAVFLRYLACACAKASVRWQM